MADINQFFENYAEVSINGKPNDLADFYGDNFVVVGPGESMVFANDEKFLKWLDDVRNFNIQTGLEKMIVQNIRSHSVGTYVIQATVTWGVIYRKTKDEIIEFDIHYMLEKFNSKLKIILYVSEEDQER